MKNITTQEAVKKLTSELKKDEGFYQSYQANIAMAFYDAFDLKKDLHANANEGAKKFLDFWINQ